MKNRAFFAVAFVTFGVVLGAMMSGAFSGSERPPENCSDTNRADKHAQENSPAVVNECRSDEGRTADYTLDLTIVTGFLVLVALGQMIMFGVQLRYMRQGMIDAKKVADASLKQSEVAHDEFVATHRPRIVVRSVKWDSAEIAPGAAYAIHFVCQNEGSTAAHIIEVGTRLIWTLPRLPADIPFIEESVSEILGSGDQWLRTTPEKFPVTGEFWNLVTQGAAQLFCVGFILYRDGNKSAKKTGFCRKWSFESVRWERYDDPEYEYSY